MTNILITGSGSFVGTSVHRWLEQFPEYHIEEVDTMYDRWKTIDLSKFDVIFHVAGLAHVNAKPKMKDLYYQVNCNLAIDVASAAKQAGVKQFIFMSSMIVFHESKSLTPEVITATTTPHPNGFYGDSKLQAEIGLHALESASFQICILRPPMIYGTGAKGNFGRLQKLAVKLCAFPELHNQRSMLYIDNLSEFVHQAIVNHLSGTYYPQNAELSDTVEIVRFFAKQAGHPIWITPIFNPLVRLVSHFLQPLNKMFATYYYAPEISKVDFEYQSVGLIESLNRMTK